MTDLLNLFKGWDTEDLFKHHNFIVRRIRTALAEGRPDHLERDFETVEAIKTTLAHRGVAYRQA